MAKKSPKIGDGERRLDGGDDPGNALLRNRMGHDEVASVDDSGEEDRVFNELDVRNFVGSIVGMPECVGTAGVDAGPGASFFQPPRKRGKAKRSARSGAPRSGGTRISESEMARLVSENDFREGPPGSHGDYKMDRIGGGEGVAKKRPSTGGFEGYANTGGEMKKHGKAYPRQHSDNIAMGAPPGGQEGDHESTHGKAEDGFMTSMGDAWPRKQKNTGGGVAEPFGNNHEGELDGGKPGKGFGASEPDNDGEFEEPESIGEGAWSVDRIERLMSDGDLSPARLQQAFNTYARTNKGCLSLEGFCGLMEAQGANYVLDENSMRELMDCNQEFLFHEYEDSDGRYWIGEEMECEEGEDDDLPDFLKGKGKDKDKGSKGKKPAFLTKESKSSEQVCAGWLAAAAKIRGALSEGNISRAHADRALQISFNANLSRRDIDGCRGNTRAAISRLVSEHGLKFSKKLQSLKENFGAPSGLAGGVNQSLSSPPPGAMPETPVGEPGGYDPNDPMAGQDGLDVGLGGEPGISDETPYDDPEAIGGYDEYGGLEGGYDGGLEGGYDDGLEGGYDDGEYDDLGNPIVTGNDLPDAGQSIGGAHNLHSPLGGGFQESRRKLRKPLLENIGGAGHKMDTMGKDAVISNNVSKNSDLPDDDVEMKEIHGGSLLGASQKNTGGQTAFEGGGAGKMTGSDGLKENASRIYSVVSKALNEDARSNGLRGKYAVRFAAVVAGSKGGKSKGPARANLSEAVADAEELILVFGKQKVAMEASYFARGSKRPARSIRIPLPGVRHRGPIMSEGRAVFRFAESAEAFAGNLLSEGSTCRIANHNWGSAVSSNAGRKAMHRAFKMLISR